VLDALGVAHDHGLLHGDLTPAAIVTDGDGRPHVVLCETGASLAPGYVAPERLGGESPTVRSDVYSVGVICYEALTGVHPFRADSVVSTAYASAHSPERPLRTLRPEVPVAVATVIARGMARLPEERFASATEFADALDDGWSEFAAAPTLSSAADLTAVDEHVPVGVHTGRLRVVCVRQRGHRARASNQASARVHASAVASGR
jgi:serine/threonine-protein kinase